MTRPYQVHVPGPALQELNYGSDTITLIVLIILGRRQRGTLRKPLVRKPFGGLKPAVEEL